MPNAHGKIAVNREVVPFQDITDEARDYQLTLRSNHVAASISTSARSRFVTRSSVVAAGSDSRRRDGRGDGYQDFLVEHVLARLERKSLLARYHLARTAKLIDEIAAVAPAHDHPSQLAVERVLLQLAGVLVVRERIGQVEVVERTDRFV